MKDKILQAVTIIIILIVIVLGFSPKNDKDVSRESTDEYIDAGKLK